MAWKKTEQNSIVTNEAGNPVWIYADGEEKAVDFAQVRQQINELNEKNRNLSSVKESLERVTKLLGTGDITEIEGIVSKAKEHSEGSKKPDDRVISLQEKINSMDATLKNKDNIISEMQRKIDNFAITRSFNDSKFIKDKVVNSTLAEKVFAEHFAVIDGQITAKDSQGNKILNDKGDFDFDFAIQKLIESSSYKEAMIKSDAFAGAGSSANYKKSPGSVDFKNMNDSQLSQLAKEHPELKPAILNFINTKNKKG